MVLGMPHVPEVSLFISINLNCSIVCRFNTPFISSMIIVMTLFKVV